MVKSTTTTTNAVDASPQGTAGVTTSDYDAIIVGAGFAGIYSLYKLRQLGLRTRVLEAGPSVGGTWFWNRYPGARCDVQSFDYSYSFSEELQQEWKWSERYATQPEILRYIQHVVDRFDLRDGIQLDTRVVSAVFDDEASKWTVTTEAGEVVSARFVIMATGCLSVTKAPTFPGLDSFDGPWYHTGHWPEEGVDFTGLRVGLVGTGSTGIQIAPRIADQASELLVFQRTPNFSLPAQNRPVDDEFDRDIKATYAERRRAARKTPRGYPTPPFLRECSALDLPEDERSQVYEQSWNYGGPTFTGAFEDLLTNKEANDTAAEFVREKIRLMVNDPVTAEALSPTDHPIGTRRPCVDTEYYQTYNRENVRLVDLREGAIEAVTPTGLSTTEGDFELDALVFAIGFDAMTGALLNIDIRGVEDAPLKEKWADGPATYLGITVADFPNLFTITGPGSPSVLANMVVSIEQHVEWLTELLRHATENDVVRIAAREEAQKDWVQQVADRAEATLVPLARSWWSGANIPGKPRVFMPFLGGIAAYGEILEEVANNGYSGFELSTS
ncbi:flavin-containing monooxygenase [Rhodococcus opacus]|uniref:flavin-containing monooxygenase n=1 Tax=Rhodococcus opacus TaxID=37919 RepID=UPI00146EE955|nr:NAD(P)/FAD-dependent oxidoreductase [Rhodococcus opacus]MDJ0420564.1 NAD(P)/FAD-dependent oxidoreductase [Rhodococcus opacus]MDV7089099.1 NAD(P)/FAD-dependent oxidoreductase [Rhodococcus opacus]UNN04594.1 NAD(P)/FAD-dependent oxidoreductase [Rhodococcus opacus]WKN52391.1 NAD(P)/FAD-dependent oxidoreductase [Rhodococcus opacus]